MSRELKNANITHVSYVDKGANKKKFFLTKADETPVFEKQVRILTKEDDEQMLVYGVVYEPNVEDSHGDFMTEAEIEKSAHGFLKEARNIDKQHNFEEGFGEVVESYVAPSDITVGTSLISKGSWVLVTKASEEIWEDIKKGEITGYSMAGTAEVDEVAKAEDEEARSFMKMMKEFFTKGEVKDRFNDGKKKRDFFAALHIFEDIFYDEVWSKTPDTNRIKEAALDFSDLLVQIANSADVMKDLGEIPSKEEVFAKAGKKISASRMKEIKAALDSLNKIVADVEGESIKKEDEEDMKAEDIQKMLDEKLEPITKKLDELEKGESTEGTGDEGANEDVKKQEQADLLKALDTSLEKALAPIHDRLETVEKARGIKKAAADADSEDQSQEDVQKNQSVFGSMFTMRG